MKLLVTRSLSEDDLKHIREVATDIEVVLAGTEEEAIEKARDVEILFAGRFNQAIFQQAHRLKWVQAGSAGVERFLSIPGFVESPVILTNARGVFDQPIAEHVLAMILSFTRGLHLLRDQQLQGVWKYIPPSDLVGSTLGIVGLGSIGKELARKAQALGMRVLAIRRHPQRAEVPVEALWGIEGLPELLRQSDHIVLSLPLTPETRHIIGRDQLALMKPTAYLYNIGRGALIDEKALIEALQEGQIAGAGLDVFEREPLPSESPLWKMPNVILTPHEAGASPSNHYRLMTLFLDNLRRFLQGEPLRNVVNKQLGY